MTNLRISMGLLGLCLMACQDDGASNPEAPVDAARPRRDAVEREPDALPLPAADARSPVAAPAAAPTVTDGAQSIEDAAPLAADATRADITTPTPDAMPDAAPPDAGPDAGPPPPPGYVRIEPGEFMMGSPEAERWRAAENETRHRVRLTRPFALKETETTQAEWAAVMGTNPSGFSGCDDCPVEAVGWDDAVDFCNASSLREGLPLCYDADRSFLGLDCPGYRLPTEAEWEFAVRAGTQTPYYTGGRVNDGGCSDPDLDPAAWICGNSNGRPQPGAQKVPNAWGLYDMHGNVSEWVHDRWDGGDYPPGPATDPLGTPDGARRIARGGSWFFGVIDARSAIRMGVDRDGRYDIIGFRPARTL
jgi:formylglycine-generating enzyme required for sulfatase activity